MEEITIVQNGYDAAYMSYLYTRVKERFSFLPATCRMEKQGDSYRIGFSTQKEYCPYVRKFAEENIADVLSVGYKTHFFQRRLRIPLLDNQEKNLLITALVAADYKDDKTHVSRKLRGLKSYCLDGVYNFCLHDLKKRWEGVAEHNTSFALPFTPNKTLLFKRRNTVSISTAQRYIVRINRA